VKSAKRYHSSFSAMGAGHAQADDRHHGKFVERAARLSLPMSDGKGLLTDHAPAYAPVAARSNVLLKDGRGRGVMVGARLKWPALARRKERPGAIADPKKFIRSNRAQRKWSSC